ncbi:hypothetical protein CPC08DRAFT_359420 [Agrocybe pediades]|nr:hypothetical protein CPC08DRAFT_359420 [Agrocybe pediades]
MQQIRQYCEAVLFLLENELSDDWMAHLIYTYYHLSVSRISPAPTGKSSKVGRARLLPWAGGNFYDFVYHISSDATVVPGFWFRFDSYLIDILEISNDLTKGTKQENIFASSACFCLAFLCDNRITAPDTRRIFEFTGIDQRRRREYPWRWRRMISRRRSLGNQPVIMESGSSIGFLAKQWDERLGNMRKAFRDTVTCSQVIQHKICTIPEFLHINKHRRDRWLRQGIDIQRQPIHRKQSMQSDRMLPARYQGTWQLWPLYMFLLDLLPRILSSSGRYEPLVTMCKTKCLASLSRCWPKKARRARQAIDAYLQRMDLENR